MKDKIKKDMVTAMKEKNVVTRDILRVVIAEIQRKEQTKDGKVDLSDGDIQKIIKKMVETAETPEDKVVLENYLPKQMNAEQMKTQAEYVISSKKYDSPKDMGQVMNYFKQNHTGRYNGQELSGIVKELLTNK